MNSNKDGEHWLGLVLLRKKCFYFDSFGIPIINENILNFLATYDKVTYSNICIQSATSLQCGKFCIAFVKCVRSNISYNNFLSLFERVDLNKNDKLIENIVF